MIKLVSYKNKKLFIMKTTLLFLSVFLSANLFGQNVYIPDANFKADLIGNPEINTNGDTEIQVSEASTFTGTIDCQDISISDLTGIEAFTAITELNCRENNISSLNVSNNNALTVLICDENNMSSLNLSNNAALTMLNCDENNLTSLDVSNCTDLMILNCYDNQITSLNLSNNAALTSLHCYNNQLLCLNVKNGNNTSFIDFRDISFTSATISAQAAVIYNSTDASTTNTNAAVMVLDFGAVKTSTSGTFTVQFPANDASSAILRIT